ncbi:MAG: polysaccharide biosynthesis tyrosine autokinase [Akkermansia sp.]|nr:polysaccharide biosynthesis tyrosine autokinase [Akkermansia sp.]
MAELSIEERRTEAVLHAQDYLQILRTRWKEAMLVFFLVFLSCALITKLMTPQYTSNMRFEIKLPRDLINLAVGSDVNPIQTDASGYDYMATQFELLISEQNLIAVANKLDLPNEWQVNEQMAAAIIADIVKVEPVMGTNLVDVFVTHSDPRVAQRICEAVALCYKEVREEKENALINEVISKRYEVLRSRQDELERKADVVRQYIRSGRYLQGIWNQNGTGMPVSTAAEEQEMNQLNNSRLTLESEIAQMTVHVSQLQTLKDEELLSYVTRTGLLSAESYSSARVRELHEAFREEEETRNQKIISGYGVAHPVLKSLDEQHRATQAQLFAELVGMRDAMQDQLSVKRSELSNLETRIREARNRLREKTLEDQKVLAALQEYSAEKARYDRLENDYIVDRMRMMAPRQTIEIYSNPIAAAVPSSPNYKLNLVVGAVVGVILGLVVAVVFNYFDTSVKSLEEAEKHLGLPVLGVIPQDVGLLSLQDGNSPDAEAYRILRTNIELKKSLFKARTLAVVSANAGEGKSTTLCNLAYVFASAGYSTLMIDADLRRPRLDRYSEIDSEVGLSNYLTSDMELKDVVVKTPTPNLYLLPAGPQPNDPSGVLSSHRMDHLIAEVTKRFDIVLFDSPPVLGVSDASLLVSKADATLVVLQPRKMPLKALLRTRSIVQNVGGQIMGLVMNNVDISADTQYQYYTTYYSYYSNDSSRKEPVPRKSSTSSARSAKASARSDSNSVADDSADIY